MAAGSSAVLSSFLINLCAAVGVFCVFSIIRSRPWCRRFFAPRRFAKDLNLKPKRLPTSLLGWIWPVLTYPEEDIIDEAGLDCAIYLRILRFGVYLFTWLSAWCLLAVLPANLTSGEIDRVLAQGGDSGTVVNGNVYRFTDFDRLSLTNVAPGSAKMWVHLISVHFVVLVTLWLLWRFNRQSVILRLMFLANAKRGGPSHTVLVTDIPGVAQMPEEEGDPQQQEPLVEGYDRSDVGAPAGSQEAKQPSPAATAAAASAPAAAAQCSPFAAYSGSTSSAGGGGGGGGGGGTTPGDPAGLAAHQQRPAAASSLGWQQAMSSSGRSEIPTTATTSGGLAAPPAPTGAALVMSRQGEDGGGGSNSGSSHRSGSGLAGDLTKSSAASRPTSTTAGSAAAAAAAATAAASDSATGDVTGGVSPGVAATAVAGGPAETRRGSSQPVSFFRWLSGGWGAQQHPAATGAATCGGRASGPDGVAAASRGRDGGPNDLAPAAPPAGSSSWRQSAGQQREAATRAAICHDDDVAREAGEERARRYAALGGEMEEPRVGLSNEELLRRLEAVSDPDETALSVLPEWGVDTSPQVPSRGKRYRYDTNDPSLDATFQARQQLKDGLTPQQFVAREFAMVYSPANLAAVNVIHDTGMLQPLVEEYDKVREQLEDYLDMQQLRLRLRRPMPHKQVTVLGAMYGDWGRQYTGTWWFKKVNAVDFWLARLSFLKGRIMDEQRVAVRRVAPSAFVTFTTRMAQAVAANSLHHHDVDAWRVHNAPAPFEVVWKNLGLTIAFKNGRLYLLWTVFWAMTLFFMIPVTAIQALIEVPKLAQVPVLGAIVTAPVIRQLLEAIVPGLALKLFLAIVPIVLRHMAILSGATSISEIDFGVVKRYFLFQVVVVFFGNIIAGSFFNQLNQWVKDPGSVVTTLGKAIPMTSTFFITYLLTNGLGVKSFAFIRLPNFVIFWILSKFAGSPRARQRLWMYQYTDNGTTVVDHTVAFLLGLTFSCINPIVCPAALAYMLVNYLGETYNNVYVYRRAYESAGRLWKTVYNQVMTALYIMQLTMLGLLSLKKFKFAPLAIPLLIFTVASHISTLTLYRRPWSVTALHDAADLDMWEADQRRRELLRAARRERRAMAAGSSLRALRETEEAASTSAAAEVPDAAPLLRHAPGKTERLFRRALLDEHVALALREDEQAEVADMYKDPCFKVKLDDLSALEELAADLRPRMDLLRDWSAHMKKRRRGQRTGPAAAPAGASATVATAARAGGGAGSRDAERGGDGLGGTPSVAVWTDGDGAGSGERQRPGQQTPVEEPPLELTKYDNKRLSDTDTDTELI